MKSLNSLVLISLAITAAAGQAPAPPQSVSEAASGLRGGVFPPTKAKKKKRVIGSARGWGAIPPGGTRQSAQSALDVARLLALVSAAKARKIEQDPVVQAQIRVRGYVLLANNLLVQLREDMKQDEAGTRALWDSEKQSYIGLRARHILVRFL